MKHEIIVHRLSIIERTMERTSKFTKFSGLVTMFTGIAVLIWASIGFWLVHTSIDVNTFVQRLGWLSLGFFLIAFFAWVAATLAVVMKSKQNGEPIFSPVTKNLILQVWPYGVLIILIVLSYVTTQIPTTRYVYGMMILQALYGLMIWSVRLTIPRPLSRFGLFVFLTSFVYLPAANIASELSSSAQLNAIIMLALVATTLGLGHLVTGISLYKDGQK